tara:strand:- start:633 stop:3614 length:2982 start_codon:yes stop_codon:yes gene_type:complete
MALNENEQLGNSLLGAGGVSEPLDEQPGNVQMAMGKFPSKIAKQVRPALEKILPDMPEFAPKSEDDVLRAARQKIQQKEAGVLPSSPAEPTAAPVIAPDDMDAPLATSPLDNPAPLNVAPQIQADDVPPQFVSEDTYNKFFTVDDEQINSVMNAPENRSELLSEGLSDFNSTKLPDEDGIQERIEAISQTFAGKITEAKRDVITREATRQLADLVGADSNKLANAILNRKQGGVIDVEGQGLAETMLAARDLLVSEMRKLDGLADAAEIGGEADLLNFRYQMELVANLQANVKGSQTEIARALGQYNVPAKLYDGVNDPMMAQQLSEQARKQDYTAMLQEHGGPDAIRKIVSLYKNTKSPDKKAAFVRGSLRKKVWNAVYEVWQHALLTNPITQTKNIVGGVLGTFVLPTLEGAAAVGIGKFRTQLLGSSDQEAFTGGQLEARLFGQMMTLREAFISSADSFANMGSSEIPGFKIDRAREGSAPAFSGEAFGQTGAIGTSIDILGNILTLGRVSFRTLEGGDTFFKVIAQRSQLYETAFLEGQARGLSKSDLSDFIAETVTNPTPEMMDNANAAAKYQTLQTDMDGVGRALQTIQRIPMVRYAVPFLKTPYNGSKYSFLDRSPLGLIWGNSKAMIEQGGQAKDEAIARIALATGVGVSIATLVATGDITGGGPANAAQKEILYADGWQPYSIKVAGKYYSYAGMEPLSSIIGLWADGAEITMNTDTEDENFDGNDLMGAMVGATLYNVSNKTFMQGFSDLVAMSSDPRKAGKFFENLGSSVMPRFISYVERMDDPVMRDAKTFIERLKSQVPGLSKDLKPKVGLSGEDIHSGIYDSETKSYNLALGPDAISPVYMSKSKNSPIVKAIEQIGTVSLPKAPSAINVPNIGALGLTDNERYFFQKRAHSLGWKLINEYVSEPAIVEQMKRAENNDTLKEAIRSRIELKWRLARQKAQQELIMHEELGDGLRKAIEGFAKEEQAKIKKDLENYEDNP